MKKFYLHITVKVRKSFFPKESIGNQIFSIFPLFLGILLAIGN